MLKIILSLFLILITVPAFAILTPNKIAVTQSSGHGTSPVSIDSDITDIVGTSVSIGVPVTLDGLTISGNGAASGYVWTSSGSLGIGSWAPSPSGGGIGTVTSVTASSPLSSSGGITPNITLNTSGTWSGNAVTATTATTTTGNAATATAMSTSGTGTQVWGMNSGNQTWINQSGSGGGVGVGTVNSGTPNYVTVYQAQSNTVGPSNIPVFDNGTNMGIGSTNPGQKLDVNGTLRGLNFVGPGTGLTGTATSLNIGGNAATVTTNANLTGPITSSGNATSVAAQTGTGSTFVMQGGNPNFTGNVGVGSAAPGQAVDVQGNVRATAYYGSGANLTGISGSISGQTTNFFPVASNSTTFIPSVVNQVSGNIGIGSASPGQTLDVQGTGRFSQQVQIGSGGITIAGLNGNVGVGSLAPGQTLDVNGTVRQLYFILSGNGAASGNVMVTNNIGLGTWMSPSSIGATGGIGSQTPWTSAINGAGYALTGTGNVGVNTATAGNSLVVVGNGQFIGTGTTNFTTNVGIGSTVPGQALDVQGTVRAIGFSGNTFNLLSSYGTSTTTGTTATPSSLKVVCGTTTSLTGAGGTFLISNLPFASSTSYQMITTQADTGTAGMGAVTQSSGSAAVITNTPVPAGSNVSHTFNWCAYGT